MKSLNIFLLIFTFLFVSGLVVFAQEETPQTEPQTVEVTEAINLDENIQPEELGVSEPKLLPDSPFYFLKTWLREGRLALTFGQVKKAELEMKFANEKLMEVKKIAQKTQASDTIKKAIENYQQELEKMKERIDVIKETAKENPEVESFLDKFIDQQTLHQRILEKLENQVPPEVLEKIKAAREEHLERFKEVMLKLEDRKEKITEKLDKILEGQKGSQFKEFRDLEILKDLEKKVPDDAKEAIENAKENILKRLQENLEKMSPQDQEKFKEYLERISIGKEKKVEILENLQKELKNLPDVTEKLIQSRDKILERIKQREKNQACITLWDPVCGKDGKTYSNICFANLAGVEINHKGVCVTPVE
jgi:hypothetical protein